MIAEKRNDNKITYTQQNHHAGKATLLVPEVLVQFFW
jgi:hypothetical protein